MVEAQFFWSYLALTSMQILDLFKPLEYILTPKGYTDLIAEIDRRRQQFGDAWLKSFEKDFPDYYFIINLVANNTADKALPKFEAYMLDKIDATDPGDFWGPIYHATASGMIKSEENTLRRFHAALLGELNKPRC